MGSDEKKEETSEKTKDEKKGDKKEEKKDKKKEDKNEEKKDKKKEDKKGKKRVHQWSHGGWVRWMCICGKRVLIGAHDGDVSIWKTDSSKQLAKHTFKGLMAMCSLAEDRFAVATGSGNGLVDVALWELEDGHG